MKRTLLTSLYYFNIFFIFFSLVLFFAAATTGNRELWMGETVLLLRTLGAFLLLVFTIWLMVIWSQNDKRASKFLLLFFLMGIYSVFYFRDVRKNNWV